MSVRERLHMGLRLKLNESDPDYLYRLIYKESVKFIQLQKKSTLSCLYI